MASLNIYWEVFLPSIPVSQSSWIFFAIDLVVGPDLLFVGLVLGLELGPLPSQPLRVHEAVTEKRSDTRRAPYTPRKSQPRTKARDGLPFQPKFKMTYKELLAISGMADKIRFPSKYDRSLVLIKSDQVLWRIQIQSVWWKVGVVVALGWDLGRIECDPLICWI